MPSIATSEGVFRILDRSVDPIADTLKAMLVGAGYVENKDDQFIDAGGANDAVDHRIAGTTDQTLTGKSWGRDTTGDFAYLLAAAVTWLAVAAGTAAKVVVYKSTGVDTTSRILGVYDIVDVTANGGDITVTFANAAGGGIMKFAV